MTDNAPDITGQHSAAGSTIGYLYQTQWPLIELVRRSRDEPDCQLALELLDDVVWSTDGLPRELVQNKHHTSRGGGLGDMAIDLWRTVRVWMDAHPASDPAGPTLTLVTTSVAAPGSAAHALRVDSYDPEVAQERLERAAADSTSATTSDVRERFLALPGPARSAFVARMRVLDGAPGIADLDTELRRELHLVVPRGHEDVFIGLVWDWWLHQAVALLRRAIRTVSGLDLGAAIDRLRDAFSEDNLPTTVPRAAFDKGSEASYADRVFVRQLDLVDAPQTILQKSVQDYYRAVTQSAAWIENNLVGLPGVAKFKEDLRDEWDRVFAWAVSRLSANAADDDKRAVGRRILEQCLASSEVAIRPQYREAFFFRGKLHELADERLVGWHPEFEELLDDLLADTAS
jgi:hypothetical protein